MNHLTQTQRKEAIERLTSLLQYVRDDNEKQIIKEAIQEHEKDVIINWESICLN